MNREILALVGAILSMLLIVLAWISNQLILRILLIGLAIAIFIAVFIILYPTISNFISKFLHLRLFTKTHRSEMDNIGTNQFTNIDPQKTESSLSDNEKHVNQPENSTDNFESRGNEVKPIDYVTPEPSENKQLATPIIECKLSVIDPLSKLVSITTDVECFIQIKFFYNGVNIQDIEYERPIEIKQNCLLSIVAKLKTNPSIFSEKTLEIKDFVVADPIIVFDDTSRTVRISAQDGAIIRYSLDGNEPTKDSVVYDAQIELKKSCTLKCYAEKIGWIPSNKIEQYLKVIPTAEERIRIYTSEISSNVIGISYKGESHVKNETSCQDYHSFTRINQYWSLAIVSDGAGSAAHSDMGSRAVCMAFTDYISKLVNTDKMFYEGKIPSEKYWDIEFRGMLQKFQKDIASIAQNNRIEFKSLASTIIILLFSNNGYLSAHVGDGRGAVKIGGEWQALFVPHKGDEANMTIFSTTINFASNPSFKMSGNYVPETHASCNPIEAFVLMSDGCECGLWKMNEKIDLPNGDFRIEERNIPFAKGLNDALLMCSQISSETKSNLLKFIIGYNNPLKKEIDDKTLLIGKL